MTDPDHEIVATWLDRDFAAELKAQAQRERRSISSLVRNVLEDSFAEVGEDRRGGRSSPRSIASTPDLTGRGKS